MTPPRFEHTHPRTRIVVGPGEARNVGAMLTELSDKQARYIGVDTGGPYKPDTYRY